MKKFVKLSILLLAKVIGLFHLSGYITRKELRIICYHGFQDNELCSFRPGLYLQPELLKDRMEYLIRHHFNFLPLERSLFLLKSKKMPNRSVVITIDDGFCCFVDNAYHIFDKLSIPVTLYITTYYMVNRNPVFRLLIQYLFWKTEWLKLDFGIFNIDNINSNTIISKNKNFKEMWLLIEHFENKCDERQRGQFIINLSKVLKVDISEIIDKKLFMIMSCDDLRFVANNELIDIQLHTHTHRFPEDNIFESKNEIIKNIANLKSIVNLNKIKHFCYPSGLWSLKNRDALIELNIESATTCVSGLNNSKTNLYELSRFVDSSEISFLEFEAELWGFSELIRRLRKSLFFWN